jgi:hypothetical protein
MQSPAVAMAPKVPYSIVCRLVSVDNPLGDLTNLDLDQLGAACQQDILAQSYDIHENTVCSLIAFCLCTNKPIDINCALHISPVQPMQWQTCCLVDGNWMISYSLLILIHILLRRYHGAFAHCNPASTLPRSRHCPSSDAIWPLCWTEHHHCSLCAAVVGFL